MATTSQSATLPDILTAIVNQLKTVTGIDSAYCHLVASSNYTINCMEPQFLYIQVLGLNPSTNAGAGRRARPVSRTIRVYVYTRTELDFYTNDTIALTGLGNHEDLELKVIDSVDEFWPRDSDSNNLTIEPLHPTESQEALREPENDLCLIRSDLTYEIVYLNKVNTPQP